MTGILLVHGAWHGPWCWDGVAERLRRRGHRVEAVRLRGHDRPPGRIWHRVHHYVEDVGVAAARFAEPPVLVGHSLGGLVVQRYLERGPAQAAVLLAPIPPGGTVAAFGRIAVRHPLILAKATLLLSLRPFIGSSALVREWFFTPDTPGEVVDHCMVRLQDESYPAFLETLVVLPRPRTRPRAGARHGGRKGPVLHRRRGAQVRTCLPDRSRDRPRHGPRPDARPGLAERGRPHRQLDPGDPRQTRHRTARTSRTARDSEEGT